MTASGIPHCLQCTLSVVCAVQWGGVPSPGPFWREVVPHARPDWDTHPLPSLWGRTWNQRPGYYTSPLNTHTCKNITFPSYASGKKLPVNRVSGLRVTNQWKQQMDLGFHPEVCLTHRYPCGPGVVVTFWFRLIEWAHGGGIITK